MPGSRGVSPSLGGMGQGGREVPLLRRLLMGDTDALNEMKRSGAGGQSMGSLGDGGFMGGRGYDEEEELDGDIGAFSPRVAEVGGTGTGLGGPMAMEPLVSVGVVPSSAEVGLEGEDEEDEDGMGLAGGIAVGVAGKPRSIGEGDYALLAESARVVDLGVAFRQLAAGSEEDEGNGRSPRSLSSRSQGRSLASTASPRSRSPRSSPGRSADHSFAPSRGGPLTIADATSRSVTLGDRSLSSRVGNASSRGVSASVAALPARTRLGGDSAGYPMRRGATGGRARALDAPPPVPLDIQDLKHKLGLAAPSQAGTPGAGGSVAAMRAAADAAGLPHSPLVQPRSARTGRVTLPSRAVEMAQLEEEEAQREREERTARYQEKKQHRKGLLAGSRKTKTNVPPMLKDD